MPSLLVDSLFVFTGLLSLAQAFSPPSLHSHHAISACYSQLGRLSPAGCFSPSSPQTSAARRSGHVRPVLCTLSASEGGRKKVVVIGGTGRVGGSTARWMLQFGEEEGSPVDVVLAGRSASAYEVSRERLAGKLAGPSSLRASPLIDAAGIEERVSFAEVDFTRKEQLCGVIRDADLVVHTAGPFQQLEVPQVLDAAIEMGVPYVDVCDEKLLCKAAMTRHEAAKKAGVAAVVSAGIWPGSSAVMAAACVDQVTAQGVECEELEMSFFTAGTGNAGQTVVAATFLLLVEPVLRYVRGERQEVEPWSEPKDIDFGGDVGVRRVWLLDEPDVYTLGQITGVPNISSRFGTAPMVWNYLFAALRLLPHSLLGDKTFGRLLAAFSDPIIRIADSIVGATNAMRIDARGGGQHVVCRVVHDDLENCVGIATAAFGMEMLRGNVKAGVHLPPELWGETGKKILERVKRESDVWDVPGVP